VFFVGLCPARQWLRSLVFGPREALWGTGRNGLRYWNAPYAPGSRRFGAPRRLTARFALAAARRARRRFAVERPWLWLYHPRFLAAAHAFEHSRLIYDCMDDFALFRSAEPGIAEAERQLLQRADIVFTGGRSLHRAKAEGLPNAHCFPSGVDYENFARAADPATAPPEEIARLPRPVLGYFGAIDERIDLELVDRLCASRPASSVVFIGPALFPERRPPIDRPNFHWLGAKPYARLPEYLKAFDVCLLPFAITPLTRHISPTKTPEYLAGGKPAVSTATPDVEAEYGDIVHIARSHEEFVARIDRALAEAPSHGPAYYQARARARSWDAIAAQMEQLAGAAGGAAPP